MLPQCRRSLIQSNELRDGLDASLFHHPSAMNFDGGFCYPQANGNLLVQQAFDYQHHDFTFAIGQRCQILLERNDALVPLQLERVLRRWPSQTVSISFWSSTGLGKKSTAPCFIAVTDMGMSPCPVMKTMGTSTPRLRSSS